MATRARIETAEGNFQAEADGYPAEMLKILSPGMGREELLEAGFKEITDEAQAIKNIDFIYHITEEEVKVAENNWTADILGE